MPILDSKLNKESDSFRKNKEATLEMTVALEELLEEASRGGGEEATARLRSRGKMPLRERISCLLDPDSPFLEISALAAWRSPFTIGSGFVVGIGVVENVECLILGHDPSVRAGAFNNFNMKKLMRGLEIARENRLPYIQFVESAGADLRGEAGDDPEAAIQRETEHFGESGRLFYEITELSKLRIPTISLVFGSSTAGGAYQPGMSDYNIFIKNQSKVFLGGPPLVKMATGEDATDEELGGADMHTRTSGLGDYLAKDESDGIRICREVVAHLNWKKLGPEADKNFSEPVHENDDLLGLVSEDLRSPFDIKEVIARITDSSYFEEFKPLYGPTLVCGWAKIHGYAVGILGNNGALFSESSEKAAQFIQLCNQINTPLIFLHNITGFIVGTDFEQGGITKDGSKMINAVANSTVPHISIILASSYGAGNYAMSGRAFGTRFTFVWPLAKIAVMGPKQMAGVMSIVGRAAAERKGIDFDERADAERAKIAEHWAEERSKGLYATSRIADDGMIDPRDTREVIAICLSSISSNVVKGTKEFGTWRM
ncbi:MAG: acetyl-CoA carboxylase carboxyltransferase subunit [Gammaproteobacteria bacterium]|nr:acetyl-CoA carboxylase carboxyltransferase subunit [Gammaproteobacteria bacterium]